MFADGKIITVNTGSSSIKVGIFATDSEMILPERSVSITNIGSSSSMLHTTHASSEIVAQTIQAASYDDAIGILLRKISEFVSYDKVVAVGHRVVHGGGIFAQATPLEIITDRDWETLSQFDPIHTQPSRQLAASFVDYFPAARHVACFDTTFFHDLPEMAAVVPIPQRYSEVGVRRYGFHGLSYESLLAAFRARAGEVAAHGRVIMAHLGSGASVTALQNGKPIDTTMGFTPVSGIAMSTRSGSLDPTTFSFLHRKTGMSSDEFDHMVNFESGLLGVSGISGDMHALLQIENDRPEAALAIDLFVYEVKKAIGMCSAVLGGVDSLIFSGGIGEQSVVLRARICQDLAYLGINLNDAANDKNAFLISGESSRAGVHVIPANEASIIARQTMKVVVGDEYGIK